MEAQRPCMTCGALACRLTLAHADTEERDMMQQALAWLTAVLLVAGLSLGTALAATNSKGKTTWHGTHTMSGTVTEVDHTNGHAEPEHA